MTIVRFSYKSVIISVHLILKISCSTFDTLCVGNGMDESAICIGIIAGTRVARLGEKLHSNRKMAQG